MNTVDYNYRTKDYKLVVGERDFSFNCSEMNDMAVLAVFVTAMEYADSIGEDEFLDCLEDWARDLAEEAELLFIYTRNGRKRVFTPASMWESSGSCEWDQSAQYGYDYGWDI